MDGIHDMGGMHGFGPVVTDDGESTHHEPWEVRAQVITLLAAGLSMRAAIEALDPATYLSSSYYERWLRAGEAGFVGRGIVSEGDLARWRDVFEHDALAQPPISSSPELVAMVAGLGPAHFEPATDARHSAGDRVAVRRMRPPIHHRCPRYVRGATGTVERVVGGDIVPAPPGSDRVVEPIYTIEFSASELFGEADHEQGSHTVLIDLFERYLEPAP
ncbi:MAG: nitrile hydratase subunit beta [Acidimicrobiia bacterium]|nr:nitrile hydratase subunit beta [Acidimicrobiia bacterium]